MLLGVKPDGWALSKDKVKIQVVAVDVTGQPLADVAVKVDLFERRKFSHRKRLIGGFYAYEYGAEIKRIGDFCEGRTDDKGLLFCEAPVAQSGNLILRARDPGCGGQRGGGEGRGLGGGRGRMVVRRGERRSHGRDPGAQALRARRDGGVPGAHAVSRGARRWSRWSARA